jgi:hypothetical protein
MYQEHCDRDNIRMRHRHDAVESALHIVGMLNWSRPSGHHESVDGVRRHWLCVLLGLA